MKKILIVAIGFIISTTALAQQKSLTISLNGGVSAPLGNFKKADYANEKSGFVKTGFNLNLSSTYHLNKSWGIGLTIGNTQFGKTGLQTLVDGYKEDSGTDSTTIKTIGENSVFSLLAGPVYTFAATEKLHVNVRLLGGYSNVNLAGFKVFYEDYTDNVMTQNKAKAGGFGVQFGAGVSYAVSNKISVLFNADYFTTKPSINIKYDNYVVNSGRKLTTYKEAISSFNATVGVGFKLF